MNERSASRDAPSWNVDGRDWPNRAHSQFIRASAIRWHVQVMGQGPVLLALHGTGASTHSFRDLAPALAGRFTVVAVDLPGHGFTSAPEPSRFTLPGMAQAVAELMEGERWDVAVGVGHSAGAAILCRMALDHLIEPRLIVSLNGALRPFQGLMGKVYGWGAQVTAWSPVAARIVAGQARDVRNIRDMVERIGSRLDQRGLRLYQRLVQRSGHTASALAMMARWDLASLERDLPRLPCPLQMVTGARDTAVPPSNALHLAARLPMVTATVMPDVGHLSHEEAPGPTAALVTTLARDCGVILGSDAAGS